MNNSSYLRYLSYRQLARRSFARLAGLEGLARGKTVYILGSGPSVNETDLARLNGEVVIYLNNALTLRDRLEAGSEYACVSDHLRMMELRERILESGACGICSTDKVLNPHVDPSIFADPMIFVMPKLQFVPEKGVRISAQHGFSDDLRCGLYLGKSVVFPAIQLAYFLGAREITLLGVDMDPGLNVYFDSHIRSNWSQFDYERDGKPHFIAMYGALKVRGVMLTNASHRSYLRAIPIQPQRYHRTDLEGAK